MSNNNEWQTHQVKQRIQARLDEAETHRQLKGVNGRSAFPLPLKMIIPMLGGLIIIIWLLTGCAPNEALTERAEVTTANNSEITMADRIQFQDARDEKYFGDEQFGNHQLAESKNPVTTMADRIRFQDTRDVALAQPRRTTASAWTMKERILFHDRIWEQNQ